MMNWRNIVTVLLVLGISLTLNAQFFDEDINIQQADSSETKSQSTPKPIRVGFETGMEFMHFNSNMNAFSNYFMPTLIKEYKGGLQIHVATMFQHTNFNMPGGENTLFPSQSQQMGLRAAGIIPISERLTVYGESMVTRPLNSENTYYDQLNTINSFSVGVSYKLSKHVTISGEISVGEGPFYSPYSGFYNNTLFDR